MKIQRIIFKHTSNNLVSNTIVVINDFEFSAKLYNIIDVSLLQPWVNLLLVEALKRVSGGIFIE